MSETERSERNSVLAVAIIAMVLVTIIAVASTMQNRTMLTPLGGATQETKTLQVTGDGAVTDAPDLALLTLGVQTQAATATEATANNAAAMTSVIDAIVSVGISKTAITTVSYTLNPVYDNSANTPEKVVGYQAQNTIQVSITDFTLLGKTLDAAVVAGANSVQGITFTFSVSKLAALEMQALQLAVKDARTKAYATASALGVTITGPTSVSPGYMYRPVFQEFTATASAAQTPIQPGPQQVSATVQVTYAFS